MQPSVNYLSAFLGGVGISLSGCVLPLLPVVISYIGIKDGTTRLKGFALSFAYVSGVAVTYSCLGLAASLSGRFFGSISSHPFSQIFAGLVIIFFSLAYLNLFEIKLARLVRLPAFQQRNIFFVFLLGLVSGLLVSPCTVPALSAILVYLAAKRNIFYGMTLLLAFAYGMGLILILAGTFSSVLLRLPKPGRWMVYLQRFFFALLFAMGIYFVYSGVRRL
ncbi:MAG: cytochrome c biogenesis protein CcdA [Candidatus Omnitrophota bacterium]|nr:cytochrome c biogenesis protein CcdA [Candidatus Omnitrophota bacterium]